MNRNNTRQWLMALMVVAGLLTTLPVAAQKATKDIDEWNENTEFGKNGADMTADGYSLWDGHSFQNYNFNSKGDIEIRNAAQLARYAWDMYEASRSIRNDRKQRNVHLLCDIDLGGYYFSITRGEYCIECATFDGHGHTIRNGYGVSYDNRCALFSQIYGGKIQDLVVENYHVNPSHSWDLCSYAAALCGYVKEYSDNNYDRCTIQGVRVVNCTVKGDIEKAGGIAGACHFHGKERQKLGSYFYDNTVINSYIRGHYAAGGILGYGEDILMYRNQAINTTIDCEGISAGGLYGGCRPNKKSGDHGDLGTDSSTDAYIDITANSVMNCSVSCDNAVGGAFGRIDDSNALIRLIVEKNLICATIINNDDDYEDAGAFATSTYDPFTFVISNNYYNTDFSALNAIAEYPEIWYNMPRGLTTEEMLGIYIGLEYEFNQGLFPQLKKDYSENLVINTADELVALAKRVSSGRQEYSGRTVFLGADIDMTGVSMTPIGTAEYPFMGEFNGQGHTISNLTINAKQDNVGLFGCLMNAKVQNVHITNANVTGKNHVGVLFGTTIFSPCYVNDVLVENSNVKGLGSVGGIGGRVADNKNIAYATIERCYFNNGTVTTTYVNSNDAAWAGGICGNVLRGKISDCGCVATITRSTSGELKAGLIGGSNGTLEVNRCYATDLNNTRLDLVAGRGKDAVVTENNCPATIANLDGMKSDLGDNWFYFKKTAQLPIPASLGKYFSDNPTLIEGDLVFYPNDLEATSYYVKEYIGTGGNVTIPTSVNGKPVTKIAYAAFYHRDDITSVTLQEGLQYIGNNAFEGTGITSLSLPGSLTGVGDEAFAACPSLTSISIAQGTRGINDSSFSKCPNLASITVAPGNTNVKAEDDILFSADGTDLILCAPKGATKGDYTVPSIVDYIPYFAFNYCTQLTGITFPAGLYITGEKLFIGCDNLRYLDFSQCNDWEQGIWGIGAGVTVHRYPIGLDDKTFEGVPEQTIIYLPADRSHDANGEKNVVIGNVGTDLVLTDGWDFDPKVAFSFPSASYDRSFAADVTASSVPSVDENGNPVYVLDSDGNPLMEYVYDEYGEHVMNGDEPVTQPVQAYTTTYSYKEKGYPVCLPFAWTLNVGEEDEAKVYAPTKIEDIFDETAVTFGEVESTTMAAYTPYYVVVSRGGATVNGQGGSVTKNQTAGSIVIDGASYQFIGSTVTIPNATLYDAQKPAYLLQSDGLWQKVPQNEPLTYVAPFRSYFQATTPDGNASSLVTMFGGSFNPDEGSGPNAIEPVVRTIDCNGTERYFDMNGRLLNGKPQKGIYIYNGKKYTNKLNTLH